MLDYENWNRLKIRNRLKILKILLLLLLFVYKDFGSQSSKRSMFNLLYNLWGSLSLELGVYVKTMMSLVIESIISYRPRVIEINSALQGPT